MRQENYGVTVFADEVGVRLRNCWHSRARMAVGSALLVAVALFTSQGCGADEDSQGTAAPSETSNGELTATQTQPADPTNTPDAQSEEDAGSNTNSPIPITFDLGGKDWTLHGSVHECGRTDRGPRGPYGTYYMGNWILTEQTPHNGVLGVPGLMTAHFSGGASRVGSAHVDLASASRFNKFTVSVNSPEGYELDSGFVLNGGRYIDPIATEATDTVPPGYSWSIDALPSARLAKPGVSPTHEGLLSKIGEAWLDWGIEVTNESPNLAITKGRAFAILTDLDGIPLPALYDLGYDSHQLGASQQGWSSGTIAPGQVGTIRLETSLPVFDCGLTMKLEQVYKLHYWLTIGLAGGETIPQYGTAEVRISSERLSDHPEESGIVSGDFFRVVPRDDCEEGTDASVCDRGFFCSGPLRTQTERFTCSSRNHEFRRDWDAVDVYLISVDIGNSSDT